MNSDKPSSDTVHPRHTTNQALKFPQLKLRVRNIPLRQVLVVPFVLQILLAVGLTGFFSLRNGQRTVHDLGNRLLNNTSDHITQYLNNYLSIPVSINQVNTNLLRQQVLPIDDFEVLGQHFWQQNQAYPTISYVGLALPDGRYVGAGRWLEDYDIVIDETDRQGNTLSYSVDDQGDRAAAVHNYTYFPRQESWYQNALGQSSHIWNISFENIEPAYISAAVVQPVYDQNGQLIGMLSADLVLSDISETLSRLNPTENSRLLILERNGKVVANANTQELLSDVDGSMQRLTLSEIEVPIIQTIAQYLQTDLDGLSAIATTQSVMIGKGRDRHFVQIQSWQGELGIDWIIILAIPETDFMEQIYANTRLTVYLCLGALLIAIGIGWLAARWISRPIEQLNQTSQAIADGDLSQIVESHAIDEIDQLADRFNQMTRTLHHLIHQLEDAKAGLEIRVEERTAELQQTLQQLQKAQWQLIHAEKMSSLSQLVAGVAHEINNPIGVIHGNLGHASAYVEGLLMLLQLYEDTTQNPSDAIQHLRDELDTDFVREDFPLLLQSMETSTARISAIVQSLRKFARLDEADIKPVDLHEGLDSAILILQNRLRGFGQSPTIQIERDYHTLPMVECHSSQINQVFLNLLTNAIDAIHVQSNQSCQSGGESTIYITTHAIDTEWVAIAIRDTGSGIPREIQARLFDPFFSTKPIGEGRGLGLFVCYQIIVDEHQGKLDLISSPGEGSTFVVKLPIAWRGTLMTPLLANSIVPISSDL